MSRDGTSPPMEGFAAPFLDKPSVRAPFPTEPILKSQMGLLVLFPSPSFQPAGSERVLEVE